MSEILNAGVSSLNPVKIESVREGIVESEYLPDGWRANALGIAVPSGVSDQPLTSQETLLGAMNRVWNIGSTFDASFGLEGGADLETGKLVGAVAIKIKNDERGIMYFKFTEQFDLPSIILERLKNGEELGNIIDDISGIEDSKEHGGAIAYLTDGKITRKDVFKNAIIELLNAINEH